jgi:hypothetical protein
MATRIQVRRGSTSDWNAANPTLNEGEIGYNTTLGAIKIGDGSNAWADLEYLVDAASLSTSLGSYILDSDKSGINGVAELDASKNILAPASIIFEGTANDFETTLEVTDPTGDRTITLPDVTGTVITTGNLSDITNIGVFSSTITMEGSTANDFELTLSAGDPTADRTITFPDATGTVALTTDIAAGIVTETATQTLTNKTLTNPIITGAVFNDGSIVFEGVTANDFETTFSITDPAADRTITFPDATGTVVLRDTTDTLTNKTLTSPVITGAVFNDGSIVFEGATADDFETTFSITDPTADRTITFPDATGTVALAANVAALSGATFTGAVSGTDLTLSGNLTVQGTTTTIDSTTIAIKNAFVFEGATTDDFETTLTVADPTEDRTLTLPNATGTLLSTADFTAKGTLLIGTATGTFATKTVGTNGKVLTADSSQADGVIWADAAGGGADLNMIIMGAFI